jgi:hypothetical protein
LLGYHMLKSNTALSLSGQLLLSCLPLFPYSKSKLKCWRFLYLYSGVRFFITCFHFGISINLITYITKHRLMTYFLFSCAKFSSEICIQLFKKYL